MHSRSTGKPNESHSIAEWVYDTLGAVWLSLGGNKYKRVGVAEVLEGTTTDATATVIGSIAIPADTSGLIHTTVRARRTGGTGPGSDGDSSVYIIDDRFKRIGTTITMDFMLKEPGEDQPQWDAKHVINGTNIDIEVTGRANNNISWEADVEIKGITV